jgi:hypothetical protein
MNPLVAVLAGSGLIGLAASQTRSQTESQTDFKSTRLRFGLGASPRQHRRRCRWACKVFDEDFRLRAGPVTQRLALSASLEDEIEDLAARPWRGISQE